MHKPGLHQIHVSFSYFHNNYCSVEGTMQTAADPKVFTRGGGGGGGVNKGHLLRWDYCSSELVQL